MKSLIVSILLAASFAASAQNTQVVDAKLKSKLKQEINYIGELYGTVYAPKAWKEKHLGWDLPAQVALAQTKLAAAQNMHDAREAVGGLIKSTQDYHVSYSFYSTEKATLPFQVKTVEGKTLIVYIDRDKLSETAFPFAKGDELLTMEKVPVAQILSENIKVLGANIASTDLALADLYLTRRSGRANFNVPQGPVTVTVKRASDGTVGSVQLAWEYTPERLSNGQLPFTLKRADNSLFKRQMISGKARAYMAEADENLYGLGVRNSFLPDFGERIWKTDKDNTFDAYIFKNEEGQNIGVVRIFGYIVDDYNKAVKDFAGIIKEFEQNTSAMIIDQNNNPGGSVFYLYSLASMLSDQVLTTPKHAESMQPSQAQECLTILDAVPLVKSDDDAAKLFGDTQGYPATYQLAVSTKNYCEEYLKQYHAGQKLSTPLYLWGVDKINPNPVHYTKPIVVLVNSLDFSGGDFFPATMQDNKRAVIVGTRTAGAGGYILEATFPNSFGFESVSFTGSIAERANLNPIENLGVTPDVEVPMTVEDYRTGFAHYQKEVKAIVKDQIK